MKNGCIPLEANKDTGIVERENDTESERERERERQSNGHPVALRGHAKLLDARLADHWCSSQMFPLRGSLEATSSQLSLSLHSLPSSMDQVTCGLVVWEFEPLGLAEGRWETPDSPANHQSKPNQREADGK